MNDFDWYGLSRTWCQVLSEMRAIIKTGHIRQDMMMSLVEELQVYGNRMEAGLEDLKDLESLHSKIKQAKQQLKELRDDE